jgi:hypothetical protein
MTDLETRLIALGDDLDVPPAVDLAARVGRSLREVSPVARRRPVMSVRGMSTRRRVAIIAAALAALIGGAALAPAVADWLGLRGVRVHQQSPPNRSLPPLGTDLDLGRASSLSEAADVLGFKPLVPARLGAPVAVWIDRTAEVPVVSLVYPDVLVGEFWASLPEQPVINKFASDPSVRIEQLTVAGGRALWFEGIHQVAVQTSGRIGFDRLRLSDSALLVEHGKVTLRIETKLGRDEAIRIAESLK